MLDRTFNKNDIKLNVDLAEQGKQTSEEGVNLPPSKVEKKIRQLRKALAIIHELDGIEEFLQEELDFLQCTKPARKRKNRKQERFEAYERYFASKGKL